MSLSKYEEIQKLAIDPATSFKRSWRKAIKLVQQTGALVISNGDEPDVVILTPEVYKRLTRHMPKDTKIQPSELEKLSKLFNEQRDSIAGEDSGERVREFIKKNLKLGGKVKAGPTF